MEVARDGEMSTPPVRAPTGLLPFLRFARLPAAALSAARRVLDADTEFRGRVAEATSESVVGREGWLFLTRPDGWEDELARAAQVQTEIESAVAEERAEQDARRRVAHLEAMVARLGSELEAARRELTGATAALADARRVSADASRRAAELEDRLIAARDERERRRSDAQAAAMEVTRLRAELAARAPVVDIEGVASAVADASAAADRLQRQLAAAVAALRAIESPPVAVEPPSGATDAAPQPLVSTSPVARRKPVPLPPAVFDDSDDAAAFLVRVNGMVLLVDGYNVTMFGWPGRPIPEQRARLVDALAELVARTGADVEVVFDGGADASNPTLGARRGVRVSFSPPGVEADDVVIARAVEVPAHRPVTVASNDRRVREGALAAGANVVSSAQLLAALRR
jgi:predicted RNA-binding protein with PIN domain